MKFFFLVSKLPIVNIFEVFSNKTFYVTSERLWLDLMPPLKLLIPIQTIFFSRRLKNVWMYCRVYCKMSTIILPYHFLRALFSKPPSTPDMIKWTLYSSLIFSFSYWKAIQWLIPSRTDFTLKLSMKT